MNLFKIEEVVTRFNILFFIWAFGLITLFFIILLNSSSKQSWLTYLRTPHKDYSITRPFGSAKFTQDFLLFFIFIFFFGSFGFLLFTQIDSFIYGHLRKYIFSRFGSTSEIRQDARSIVIDRFYVTRKVKGSLWVDKVLYYIRNGHEDLYIAPSLKNTPEERFELYSSSNLGPQVIGRFLYFLSQFSSELVIVCICAPIFEQIGPYLYVKFFASKRYISKLGGPASAYIYFKSKFAIYEFWLYAEKIIVNGLNQILTGSWLLGEQILYTISALRNLKTFNLQNITIFITTFGAATMSVIRPVMVAYITLYQFYTRNMVQNAHPVFSAAAISEDKIEFLNILKAIWNHSLWNNMAVIESLWLDLAVFSLDVSTLNIAKWYNNFFSTNFYALKAEDYSPRIQDHYLDKKQVFGSKNQRFLFYKSTQKLLLQPIMLFGAGVIILFQKVLLGHKIFGVTLFKSSIFEGAPLGFLLINLGGFKPSEEHFQTVKTQISRFQKRWVFVKFQDQKTPPLKNLFLKLTQPYRTLKGNLKFIQK